MAKELLFSLTIKDFEVQTFCAGGPGGQHQNKTASAVRIVHRASGAVGESREEREQSRNKKKAFERCVNSKEFKLWTKLKASEIISGETTQEKLDRLMADENILTEVKDKNGKWVRQEGELSE